ncbi:MobH family relaxase [Motilimonas eburnea]|uniref:MobH family relaxase n=1 Tax=Motilimonas eburnea TaxID=1737488 RepID=UPI001E3210E6|nr:MobH family relaxase [Motilimonas eburnea]MCE2572811.1 TraI domain-containing protein [Motilimonas eburnea]
MLSWLKQRSSKHTLHQSKNDKRQFQNRVLSGVELLKCPQRVSLIKEINKSISISQNHWEELYSSLIINFVTFVQSLPASEGDHHSYAGGLLDHSLEAMKYAVRARRGVLYPIGGKEDLISQKADIFTYAVSSAALLHDVGKVITDLLVVHTVQNQDEPKIWTPTLGNMPIGQTYTWKANSNRAQKPHEIAGLQVLPFLIPKKAQMWLFSDQELYLLWVYAVSGQYGKAGLLGELVKSADQESVQENISKVAAMPVNSNRFQQSRVNTESMFTSKLVQVLRDELQKGEIRLNVAGAAGWVKNNRVYLVSKLAAEMLRNKMFADESVQASTPKNLTTIINMLNEANLLIRNADGEAIYYFKIVDRKFKNDDVWQQTLSFIVIDQEQIDPKKTLGEFEGEITEVTRFESTAVEEILKPQESLHDEVEKHPKQKAKVETQSEPKKKETEPNEVEKISHESLLNDVTKNVKSRLPDSIAPLASNPLKDGKTSIAWDVEVNNWIKLMLKHNQITYNQPNSLVHILERKVCLVTPSIFKMFVNENPQLIESIRELQGQSRGQIQKTIHHQYLIKMHPKTLTGFSGDNELTVLIKGKKKRLMMKVIALKDGRLMFDEIPENNNSLEWGLAPMI